VVCGKTCVQSEIEELKELTEFSLEDELPEFDNFLEVDCGSILDIKQIDAWHRPGVESGKRTVKLIHKTLLSFFTNPQCCNSQFYVNGPTTHHYAL
jgi:hypothetical protein